MKLYSQVYVYHRFILYDVNKDQYQVPEIETQSEQLQITLSSSQDFTCFLNRIFIITGNINLSISFFMFRCLFYYQHNVQDLNVELSQEINTIR